MEEEDWGNQGKDGEISYRSNVFHNLILEDDKKKLTNL
jgi:hypothetical protein